MENYFLDLNEIFNFVFNQDRAKENDSEITEVFSCNPENKRKLDIDKKIIKQVKTEDNTNKETMKYDLFKTFLTIMNDMNYGSEDDMTGLNMCESTVMNTMLSYGFLKEIKNNKKE